VIAIFGGFEIVSGGGLSCCYFITCAIISTICATIACSKEATYTYIVKGDQFYNANPYAPASQYTGYEIFNFASGVSSHADLGAEYEHTYITTSTSHHHTTVTVHHEYFCVSPIMSSSPYTGEYVTFWAISYSSSWSGCMPPSCEGTCTGIKQQGTDSNYYYSALNAATTRYNLKMQPGSSPIFVQLTNNLQSTLVGYRSAYLTCIGITLGMSGLACIVSFFVWAAIEGVELLKSGGERTPIAHETVYITTPVYINTTPTAPLGEVV